MRAGASEKGRCFRWDGERHNEKKGLLLEVDTLAKGSWEVVNQNLLEEGGGDRKKKV